MAARMVLAVLGHNLIIAVVVVVMWIRQIFIILTNGESLDPTQTAYIAEFAISQGWRVIGVFIGDSTAAGFREMQTISSTQVNVEQLRADSFSDLQARVMLLRSASAVASVSPPGHFTRNLCCQLTVFGWREERRGELESWQLPDVSPTL